MNQMMKKRRNLKTKVFKIRCSEELFEKIKEEAENYDWSISFLIRWLMEKHLAGKLK